MQICLTRISSIHIAVNDDVPFAGALTDDEIVASVQTNETEEHEEVEQEENIPRISNRDVIKSFDCLKLYITQCSEDRSASLKLLEKIEKDLEVVKAQPSIKSFFSI